MKKHDGTLSEIYFVAIWFKMYYETVFGDIEKCYLKMSLNFIKQIDVRIKAIDFVCECVAEV